MEQSSSTSPHNTEALEKKRLEIRRRLRSDFPYYAPRCLKIRTKDRRVAAFNLNAAQLHMHRAAEDQKRRTGRVRKIVLKGRQQGCCLGPDTLVLMADLTWRPIYEVAPGDEVVACDENIPGGRGCDRKMRTATVEVVAAHRKPAYRIRFDDGREVVSTGDHRWLTRQPSQSQTKWRTLDDPSKGRIAAGTLVRWITKPWGPQTYEDGWFGGLLDGEGSMASPREVGCSVRFSQLPGAVLDRGREYLESRGYRFSEGTDASHSRRSKFGGRAVGHIEVSRMDDLFRLIGQSRPSRFIDRRWWEGKSLPGKASGVGWATVVSIEPIGEAVVYDLQTSTKTFIADGFVSHNSTYIGGRFYHVTSQNKGGRAFILTHKQEATDNLFEMTERFHKLSPEEVRPVTGKSNAKELTFPFLDSGYKVGTAGSKGVGRSETVQFFHWSEVAFCEGADEHLSGILQAVPDMPGTEIWLESTSDGMGNTFYLECVKAIKGKSEFEFIFIPWFWQDEYRKAAPPDFVPDKDEGLLIDQHGLDHEQLTWRRSKIAELNGLARFKKEYPSSPEEAFEVAGANVLIGSHLTRAAIVREVRQVEVPITWGVDCARFGEDDNTLAKRRGNKLLEPVKVLLEGLEKGTANTDTMAVARAVLNEYRRTPPSKRPTTICVDTIGVGAGVADRCREDGLPVMDVNVSEKPSSKAKFHKLRDELWWDVREWFEDMRTNMPDDEALILELSSVTYDETSAGRIKIESKKEMKKRLGFSPDRAEAFLLTFAASDLPTQARAVEPPSYESEVG